MPTGRNAGWIDPGSTPDSIRGGGRRAAGASSKRNPICAVRRRGVSGLAVAVAASIVLSAAQAREPGRMFLTPELQAMEADDGTNPGMLWVEQGTKLWETPDGSQGRSCASCHGAAASAMTGAAARYPAYDAQAGSLLNLELRINRCRTERMGAAPLAYESNELLALTAYVAHRSRGLPMDVRIDGPAAAAFAAGETFFHRRQGQLNLACSQCHDDNVGKRLRGDRISHGLGIGYPVYRLEWQTLGSLHRRLRACALGVRAHRFESGSPEYVNLELYLAWRARGLPIETPGVRR
ncbi:MAG: sulfur oxidation c-type cytochrome SoxA [Hyphomicrobiaceae bacterium]